jgi:multicomponent Na+:H+ antiporter subunit D
MSGWLLVAPILIPLLAAIAGAFGWGQARLQRGIGVAGAAALLLAAVALFARVESAGVQAVQLGSWPAPFGISLVADLLSALMVLVSATVGLAVAVYATTEVDERTLATGFFPFFHALLMGVCGAFLTGDLFNLYVWFEVMLLASFVLLVAGGGRRSLTSGVAYVSLNLLASGFFLAAVGILYGKVGTLNLADLALKLATPDAAEISRPVAMLLVVAFGIKAGLFPVFFWLPASYPTTGFAVSALFAGLLTKVGVYALIRVFTLLFPLHEDGWLVPLLLAVSVATMASGVLAAASQAHVRRILSFHIVSQIGYMTLGLALATPLALASAIFYVLHHIVTKTNLFLVGGLIARAGGGEDLARLGSLGARRVGLALLFAVPALSLAGVPPLSGFFAKLYLIRAGVQVEAFAAVAVALAVGLLTLFSMTKIWSEAFWKPAAGGSEPTRRLPPAAVLASAVLAGVTVGLGLGAEALWSVAERAAHQLHQPDAYLQAVLGSRT